MGSCVLEALTRQGADAAAVVRCRPDIPTPFACYACDLADDPVGLQGILKCFRPQSIVHLAGCVRSCGGRSEVLRNNTAATLNLLEACRQACPHAHLLAVSSSAVYGQGDPPHQPLTERHPPAPRTVYGVSKAAVECLALQHWRSYGLPITIVRPFNIFGPGQHQSFVISGLARQICLIEAQRQEPWVSVGNLATTRDFTDVRDAADALILLSQSPQPGRVFNLCSGTSRSIGDAIDQLRDVSGVEFAVKQRRELARLKDEVDFQVGDPALLQATIGWQPHYRFDRTLKDLLLDWKTRLGVRRQA